MWHARSEFLVSSLMTSDFFFVVQFDNVILQKKITMQVLQCLRLGPFQKIVENRKNIILLHLHSIALSKLQVGTQIHHCIVWFQKLPLLFSIFRWPLLEPNIFTVHCLLFLILHIYLYDDLLGQEFFLCVNECRRLKKILLWVEHCTKIKVFIFEPQTFYGHTSKNYTTVYFYNVFITAYIHLHALAHIWVPCLFIIYFIFTNKAMKKYLLKFEKLVNTCSNNN